MECDRISELPDSLLTQILSYLPTKDSVTTSVLSKRWEFLWLGVPVLDLKVDGFLPHGKEVFVSFMCKFMEFNHNSRMQKFKIKYDGFNMCDDRLVEWIGPAVDRGLQHLDIETDMAPYMQGIYKSTTLVSLKLLTVAIPNPEFDVYLPCLKIMHLEDIWYGDDPLIMEKLISGCPVLEDLTLIRFDRYGHDVLLFLRVSSHTLKRFHHMFEFDVFGIDFAVEIDAPNLKYMNFRDCQSERIVLKNLTSLLLMDIDTEFNTKYGYTLLDPEETTKRDIIRDFLTGISSVRHMKISLRTLEVLYQYSKFGSFPKFDNLLCLEAAFSSSMLPFLPVFLESSPNLKNLILDFSVSTEREKIELSHVPLCLLSNIECVEIKELIMGEETGEVFS